MQNEFSALYDTEVKIFNSSGTSSYSSNAEMTFVKVISADLQPYFGGLSDKEFTLRREKKVRMFFSVNDAKGIAAGMYAEADGIMYRIEYAEKRSLGAMALMKEVI